MRDGIAIGVLCAIGAVVASPFMLFAAFMGGGKQREYRAGRIVKLPLNPWTRRRQGDAVGRKSLSLAPSRAPLRVANRS
jgi:hypothetical protein